MIYKTNEIKDKKGWQVMKTVNNFSVHLYFARCGNLICPTGQKCCKSANTIFLWWRLFILRTFDQSRFPQSTATYSSFTKAFSCEGLLTKKPPLVARPINAARSPARVEGRKFLVSEDFGWPSLPPHLDSIFPSLGLTWERGREMVLQHTQASKQALQQQQVEDQMASFQRTTSRTESNNEIMIRFLQSKEEEEKKRKSYFSSHALPSRHF